MHYYYYWLEYRGGKHVKIADKCSQDKNPNRPLDRWQDKLNEEQRQALSNMFLLAFHKAKHARPMRSYEVHCASQEA